VGVAFWKLGAGAVRLQDGREYGQLGAQV